MNRELTVKKNDKYRNNGELLKELQRRVKYEDFYCFDVVCYTSSDTYAAGYEDIITDLEVHVYINGEHDDVYWTRSIVTRVKHADGETWGEIVEEHRTALAAEKKKLFKYLSSRLDCVELAADFNQ